MQIKADDGSPIDASFSVEGHPDRVDIVLHSRGGTKDTPTAKNTEYARGLKVLLNRVTRLGATILDIVVDSTTTAKLPNDARRVVLSAAYPIALADVDDSAALAREIGSAQAKVARSKDAAKGGGNPTRRIRISVRVPGLDASSAEDWEFLLANMPSGSLTPPTTASPAARIAAWAAGLGGEGEFDPKDLADAVRRTMRSIAVRQGQVAFRSKLLRVYDGRCAVTRCDLEPALEGAHIVPYSGSSTNHIQNGLLLRADIHTLFDRHLLSIQTPSLDPGTWRIIAAPAVRKSQYGELCDRPPHIPASPQHRPALKALQKHREAAGF